MPNGATPTFDRLLTVLKPVLFDKKTQEGLVIASANLLRQGQLAYLIFGQNKKHALEIEARAQKLLTQLS